MDIKKEALKYHAQKGGKLGVYSKMPIENKADLSLAYTPGVAQPCIQIAKNPADVYQYTFKSNMVAIVTDGTAVLGLGDIGAQAALPVMEGKSLLLKKFANVDAFPICLATKDPQEIIRTVELISPGFGGINLEDIAAPNCVEIFNALSEKLDIPLFHDDQHGTAIVTVAALINSLKVVKKKAQDLKVVLVGAGASGYAVTKMMQFMNFKDILVCDINGILHREDDTLNFVQKELAQITNKENQKGDLASALNGADIFIGLSCGGVLTKEMVATMNKDSIIFAMANPTPEIFPDEAKQAGALIVGTGRSDFSNQVNNVLAMPGVFRGAIDAKATKITENMKLAASHAIASLLNDEELNENYILPDVFDERLVSRVSEAVKAAAISDKVIRKNI